jgi:hypothetical protein
MIMPKWFQMIDAFLLLKPDQINTLGIGETCQKLTWPNPFGVHAVFPPFPKHPNIQGSFNVSIIRWHQRLGPCVHVRLPFSPAISRNVLIGDWMHEAHNLTEFGAGWWAKGPEHFVCRWPPLKSYKVYMYYIWPIYDCSFSSKKLDHQISGYDH